MKLLDVSRLKYVSAMKRPAQTVVSVRKTPARDPLPLGGILRHAWYGRSCGESESEEGEVLHVYDAGTVPENWTLLSAVAPVLAKRVLDGSSSGAARLWMELPGYSGTGFLLKIPLRDVCRLVERLEKVDPLISDRQPNSIGKNNTF